MKKIHFLQHVPFEGPGYIKEYCRVKGIELSGTKVYEDSKFEFNDFDLLAVLGGPMSVNDNIEWLSQERKYIENFLKSGKPVIGVCLGAQIIAQILGSKVYKNQYREIGWFPLERSENNSVPLPENFFAFHWHGETFDIPKDAVHIASSQACKNQAFLYNDNVLALQFHLETTEENVKLLVENAADEIDGTEYVQSIEEISSKKYIVESNRLMAENLDYLLK